MMSIINLDSFREETVKINGQVYNFQPVTVRDIISRAVEQKLDRSTVSAFACSAVAVLKERSNVPESVLETLTLSQMNVLLLAVQGADFEDVNTGGSGGE